MSQNLEPARTPRSHPLVQLIMARLREFCREPAAIFWVYGFPLIMVVTLGVAFRNQSAEKYEVAVVSSKRSDEVRTSLAEDVRFKPRITDQEEARQLLRVGKVDVVIRVPDSSSGECEYSYDPTRPGSVLARDAADDLLQRRAGRRDAFVATNREVSEPGGRYIDFLVPGLIGMGLMGGGMWGVGFAIVDMRIRKLLKRYLATPMRRGHFLAGIMLSRLAFTLPEVAVLLVCARLWFGVEIHGSLVTTCLLIMLGAFQFAGIGLLVASRAETLETVSGLMNLVMLPMWIASGIFFSVERFPPLVQPAIQCLPLTPLIEALRRVILEGAGLGSIGLQLATIVAWGTITFVLALRWFRWN
jgi:ABC-type multidrug transport system permease subunit